MDFILTFLLKVFKVLILEEYLIFFPCIFLFFYSIFLFKNSKNKNIFLKILIFFLPVFYIFYSYSILPDYFSALGQDSLIELTDTVFSETIFFIKNFLILVFDPLIFLRNRFWLILISSFFVALVIFVTSEILVQDKKRYILICNKVYKFSFLFVLVVILTQSINLAVKSYQVGVELKNFENSIKDNVNNIVSKKEKGNNDLLVVTYIGESTSALNLSLYGYPLNTTPWLKTVSKNKNFILFKRIFAEHTHTLGSLTKSLSICLSKNCLLEKKYTKNFFPMTDIINKSGIDTYLYSTQGNLGGLNAASNIVLNAKNQFYPYKDKKDKYLGDRFISKIKDKDFFSEKFCKNSNIFKNKNAGLVFLHSYAGHFGHNGYSEHIQKDLIFDYPSYINKKNYLGKDDSNFDLVKEYDAAMRYIDTSIQKTIECTFKSANENKKPVVFLYFSDHGEAPASRKGHDSNILSYEMIHVPFFIYFNDIAYELFKDKFDSLNEIKNENRSLSIIKETILYLFEMNVVTKLDNKEIYDFKKFPYPQKKFIIERQLLNDKRVEVPTFWSPSFDLRDLKKEYFDNQNVSITLWQLQNYLNTNNLSNKKNISNLVCQHRANSYALQFKASLSIGCFETDIIFLKDKALSAHGIKLDTNLIFDNFLKSDYQKNTVWLDSKNINVPQNCEYANDWLKKNNNKFESLLVEMPISSIKSINNTRWLNCIKEINNLHNVEVAYYLDTNLAKKCTKDIESSLKNSINCRKFYSDTFSVLDKTKIKSITFDHKAAKIAVMNDNRLNDYKWHTWHVDSMQEFEYLKNRKNTGIILLKNHSNLENFN